MRGFLSGVSFGAVVAVIGASLWSLSAPLPATVQISDVAGHLAAVPTPAPVPENVGPAADPDLVDAQPEAPKSDTGSVDPKPDQLPTASPDKPEVREEIVIEQPQGNAGSDVELDGQQSVLSEGPSDMTAPEIPTGTAQPDPVAAISEIGVPADEAALPEVDQAKLAQMPSREILPEDDQHSPETPDVPVSTEVPEIAVGSADVPNPVLLPAETEVTDDRIASLPQVDGNARQGGVGDPIVPLTERETQNAGTEAIEDTRRPFERNSELVLLDDEQPLMSIILVETDVPSGVEALSGFPYPITFAINPSDPDAAERMKERREAGFEVLILSDLPRDATPQDAETAFPIWFDRLPEAVGVLEGVETGFQGNRALADQTAAIVADAGFGFVTQDQGLNTVAKLALRDGVPTGIVFRDFDGAGQDPRAMRRFLDQAAFRANQSGAVIMLGRLKPSTITALLHWGLQDRASRVQLVPVSASLSRYLQPVTD